MFLKILKFIWNSILNITTIGVIFLIVVSIIAYSMPEDNSEIVKNTSICKTVTKNPEVIYSQSANVCLIMDWKEVSDSVSFDRINDYYKSHYSKTK